MLPKDLIGTPHAPLDPLNRLLWAVGVLSGGGFAEQASGEGVTDSA